LIFIFLKKALGLKIGGADHAYLAYLFALERCDLKHISEGKDFFKVSNKEGVFFYLRKSPSSDAQVLYQIWSEKEYEIVADYIEKNFQKERLRIIDAGANVGYASLYLFHRLKHRFDMEFVVIEPDAGNLDILQRNFEANKLLDYHIEKAGLFNKECYLHIRSDFRDGKEWSLQVEETNEPTDLKGVEIVRTMGKYGWDLIDFMKIDIEGSEKYLFEEDSYVSGFLSKIKLLSIEVHEEYILQKEIEKSLINNSFGHFSHGEITIGHNLQLNSEN
jgi:FkbM family methyltransferase